MPDKRWADELAAVVRDSLLEFSGRMTEQLEMLAVDCHPWNGVLALAALTHAEKLRDPPLADPSEMAAWRHYDFGSALASWTPAAILASRMREEYYGSGDSKAAVAEAYICLCAAAAATDDVRNSLGRFRLSDAFRISVSNPDTGEEYFSRR